MKPSNVGLPGEWHVPISAGCLRESLGVETQGGTFIALIEAGVRVPCEVVQRLSTTDDNQSSITLRVYRGTQDRVEKNRFLGELTIKGFESRRRGIPVIEVTLRVLEDGTVKAETNGNLLEIKRGPSPKVAQQYTRDIDGETDDTTAPLQNGTTNSSMPDSAALHGTSASHYTPRAFKIEGEMPILASKVGLIVERKRHGFAIKRGGNQIKFFFDEENVLDYLKDVSESNCRSTKEDANPSSQ